MHYERFHYYSSLDRLTGEGFEGSACISLYFEETFLAADKLIDQSMLTGQMDICLPAAKGTDRYSPFFYPVVLTGMQTPMAKVEPLRLGVNGRQHHVADPALGHP